MLRKRRIKKISYTLGCLLIKRKIKNISHKVTSFFNLHFETREAENFRRCGKYPKDVPLSTYYLLATSFINNSGLIFKYFKISNGFTRDKVFRKKHKKLKAVQSSEIRSHPNQKPTQVFIKITPSKNAPFQNRSLNKCIFKITFSKLLPQKRIFKITFIKIAPLKKYFFKIAPSSNVFSKLLPQKLHFQNAYLKTTFSKYILN